MCYIGSMKKSERFTHGVNLFCVQYGFRHRKSWRVGLGNDIRNQVEAADPADS